MTTKIKLRSLIEDMGSVEFNEPDTCVVGRGEDCSIRVPHEKRFARVSKYHCAFETNPPETRVRDLGSMNGTYVNGKIIGQRRKGASAEEGRLEEYMEILLKDGDRVDIADGVGFVVEIERNAHCARCKKQISDPCLKDCERAPDYFICSDCLTGETEPQEMDFMISSSDSGVGSADGGVASDFDFGAFFASDGDEAELVVDDDQPDESGNAPLDLIEEVMNKHNVKRHEDLPIFEKYRMIKPLGKGGMGTVYLVEENETGKRYALKLMNPDAGNNPDRTKRFVFEAENTRSLVHPNIVTFYEHGISGGQFYFLIEYCEGGSVDQVMPRYRNRLPLEMAAHITLATLDALEYSHNVPVRVMVADGTIQQAIGLVHRDIKPHNIFLLDNTSQSPHVKVGDYGLAKAFQLSGLTGMTTTGQVMGTPCFLPRQYAKTTRYAKPDIDVYSVAASMYFMLTAKFPRNFRNDRGLLHTLLCTPHVSIRNRGVRLPTGIADLLDHAIDDSEELHFKTARSFKAALEKEL
ncbi:protein kinase [Candidatus Hydrogenedentota bacterium]